MSTQMDVGQLRALRNSVIGSRTKKSELVAQGKIPSFVNLLADPTANEELQSLAATIIGSLAHAAPPPTLLSLCRAHTTEALLASLDRLSRNFDRDPANDNSAATNNRLKLLESLLRAFRSLMIALADELAPGTKWERSLGLTSKVDSASPLQAKGRPLSAIGKSSREIIGWHIADAGFEADGDIKMTSASSGKRKSVQSAMSKQQELVILARDAIDYTFRPESLPLWLGAIFISKLPMIKSIHSPRSSQQTSLANSRASTRPVSPAVGTIHLPLNESSLSRSSSRMSLSSLHNESRTFQSGPPTPIMTNQVRLLAITEMVLGILSSCLTIAGNEELSPVENIARRRRLILSFVASDSPFWITTGDATRGRRSDVASLDEPMQASFVKRGKSTEDRHRDEKSPLAFTDDSMIPQSKSVLDVLLEATECGYTKTQESALWALTDLSRENTDTSRMLFTCSTPSGLIPTSMLLNLRKDSSAPIRLAAFCCLAHIIKVHPFTPRTNECVLAVLAELTEFNGDVQVAAIFALSKLLADDTELQILACDQYDCIDKLAKLLEKSKHLHNGINKAGREEVGHDEHSLHLREAVLLALATLCFQRDDIRRRFVDHSSPTMLPLVVASLSSTQVGVRIAACRLIRALSRSTSILRTSLVDAGVATKLLAILHNDAEDEQVIVEATGTICNLVLNFSPMKQVLMEGGGIDKLVELAKTSYGPGKLNALWALKNVLYSSDITIKMHVMEALQWKYVADLARGHYQGEDEIQEQALNIIRNVCSSRETDIEEALQGFGGGENLLDLLEDVIWQGKNDNILEQAAFILVNMATGNEDHRKLIIDRANLLDVLVFFLNHPRPEIREAGIWAVTNLTQVTPRSTRIAQEAVERLKSFHFDVRLKELIDDPERDVSDRAKGLLSRFVD